MGYVIFGTINSNSDLNLMLLSKEIGAPEPKTKQIDIPGANGSLDLTEALQSDIKYKNRKLKFNFAVFNNNDWADKYQLVLNKLHGKKMNITLDDDDFYYTGRINVSEYKSNGRVGTIVIEVDAEPYKHKDVSTSYVVTNSKTITITGNREITYPTFTVSNKTTTDFTVGDGTNTMELDTGVNANSTFALTYGVTSTLTFTGSATVAVNIKEGSL